MIIYILRHAIAVPSGSPGYPGDDRPLTEEGIEKMTREALGIRRIVPKIDLVLTSPLKRAHQTATIAAKALGRMKELRIEKQLLPGGNPDQLLNNLAIISSKEKGIESVLLVGHEPYLGKLTSQLIGSSSTSIEFKKGALCRIDIDQFPSQLRGRLAWLLTPKQLRELGDK
jgi:phosphohistidine phosphatase